MDKAVFTYDWSIEENEDDEEGNTIRIWGLDENNDTVCLQIEDFKPYVYMELPDDLTWTPLQVKYLKNKIKEILYNQKLDSWASDMNEMFIKEGNYSEYFPIFFRYIFESIEITQKEMYIYNFLKQKREEN